MKIVFAVKTMLGAIGGAERVLAEVASGLAARGHKVTLISYDNSSAGESFYPLAPEVAQRRLGIGNAAAQATLKETLQRMVALRKAVLEEKPDIVIGFMHSMFVPLSFALIGTGIPVIGSEHIVPAHYKTRKLEFALFVLSSFFIDKITVLSETIRDSYPAILRGKMVVMPNPVKKPTGVAMGDAEKMILNVGRLDPQKDQETLIRAFKLLADTHPAWGVKIIGEGALEQRLKSLIAELGLQGRVELVPQTKKIDDFYRSATIFALPSRYESFGLATAEAMSYGVPPVGFADCPGTSELIEDGRTGILVEGGDRVEAFAEGLAQLMVSPESRAELGTNARNAIARFSPDAVVGGWEALLQQASLA